MSVVNCIEDVAFGGELPPFEPDTGLDNVRRFATAVGWIAARFSDHELARAEGLPGALVPGIMSQAFLTAMIHRWAPAARVVSVDTIFRAPVLADAQHTIRGVVTDIDEEASLVEIDLSVTDDAGVTRVFGTARVRLPSGG